MQPVRSSAETVEGQEGRLRAGNHGPQGPGNTVEHPLIGLLGMTSREGTAMHGREEEVPVPEASITPQRENAELREALAGSEHAEGLHHAPPCWAPPVPSDAAVPPRRGQDWVAGRPGSFRITGCWAL